MGGRHVRTDTAGSAAATTATAASATAASAPPRRTADETAGGSNETPGEPAQAATGIPPAPAPVQYRITAKLATPVVTVSGTLAQSTLWAFGRIGASHVTLQTPQGRHPQAPSLAPLGS